MDTIPVVPVHGAFSTGEVWESIKTVVESRGHRVFPFDLPGHDKNHPDPAGCSIDITYARAAVQKIGEITEQHGPPIVCGHSMGGLIAAMAARRNHRIRGLALFASAPSYERSMSLDAQLRLAAYSPLMLTRRFLLLSDRDFHEFFWNDVVDRNELEKRLNGFVPESWTAIRQMASHQIAIRPELIYAKDVAIFAAEYDRIMTVESQHHLARAFGVTARIIPASHMSLLWHQDTVQQFADWVDVVAKRVRAPEIAAE